MILVSPGHMRGILRRLDQSYPWEDSAQDLFHFGVEQVSIVEKLVGPGCSEYQW